jgi:hypothetical protein
MSSFSFVLAEFEPKKKNPGKEKKLEKPLFKGRNG